MTVVNIQTGEIVSDAEVINYDIHPVADLFPFMQGEAFAEFVEDIRRNGQRDPVVLDRDGRLIDGRNRARACATLGIDVREETYYGDDVDDWIISHNVHRRHLTESQRAMVAAKLTTLKRGGDRGNQHVAKPSIEGLADRRPSVTNQDAARALNVSRTSVERARLVRDHGDASLQQQVESGQITVSKAATAIREARKPDPDRRPAAERIQQINEFAEQGYTSEQIGKRIGVSETQVRRLARDHEVTIRADVVRGKVRRINHDRVLDSVATTLETAAFSLRDIDVEQLDREEAAERLDSLTTSINALAKAIKKIKESLHE